MVEEGEVMSNAIVAVRSTYKDIDTMDVGKLISHLTQDCQFIFANMEPLVGHGAIESNIGGFMASLERMVHSVVEAWRVDAVIFSRLQVTYRRRDGVEKSYPAAVLWRMRGPLISEFRIYVDNSDLFS